MAQSIKKLAFVFCHAEFTVFMAGMRDIAIRFSITVISEVLLAYEGIGTGQA